MTKNNNHNFSKKLFLPVFNFIKNKEFNEALGFLDKLLAQKEDANYINKLKALIYLNKKDWRKSLLHYEKIPKERTNFEILNNTGVTLYKLGRFSEASELFKKSIDDNNKYVPAYENFCVTNKLLGNYELSIKFCLDALKLVPENIKLKNNLIDILNYFAPKKNQNLILKINDDIKKLNLKNTKKKFLENFQIKKILNKSQEILDNGNFNLNYPHTQIFRKNKINLNCERHLNIFAKHEIIPKFCFNCYKVQINLNNVLELLKLYFYFNNLVLEKDNIRKCIVELRKNVNGNYKGYIFCDSLIEATNIKKNITNDLQEKLNINKIEIKHGCTEYYEKFESYKNINENVFNQIYKKNWSDIEKKFDDENFIIENKKERIFNSTLNIFNLPDFLIIKNWLIYAKIIGDNSYKKVYKYNIEINHLSHIELQKIEMRKKKFFN